MAEVKWGVYAPQGAEQYQRAASLSRLHARIGPLHVRKETEVRPRRNIKVSLLNAVIFCLLAVGTFYLVKAGEVAFWTGYEAQALKGYK